MPLGSLRRQVSIEALTQTSTKSVPIRSRAYRRNDLNGEISPTIVITPFLHNSRLIYATLFACNSLFCFEKPSSGLRFFLTSSPSRTSTFRPLLRNSVSKLLAIVVFPAPGRPVNQTTHPDLS